MLARSPRLVWFLGVLTLSVAAAKSAKGDGEFIDRVWSGHPVGFALLTERGHQFIAYYDATRRLTVAGRALGEAHWTRVQPPGDPVPRQSELPDADVDTAARVGS